MTDMGRERKVPSGCYRRVVTSAAPRLGVTLGDPSGIGPEIVAAALARVPALQTRCVVYGHRALLERGARTVGVTPPTVEVVDVGEPTVTPGQPDAATGRLQVAYLEHAIAAARAGTVAGLVTAPISKTWARAGGLAFPGHTELLADRFAADPVAMMFAGPSLRVALATVHVPLAQVARELTAARIVEVGGLLAAALVRDFAIAAPRLGVVGLNPHAGEGGMLGTEDRDVIAPAIEALRARGLAVDGPLVPDAAFRDAAGGRWDGVVAMYHDQALIPVKLVDFERAVNVTLGLPIVRTSPDHGTAYDLAGTGTARFASMLAALELAAQMVDRRALK
jgi:4-hydroxythreonine-4-phosphate dehydrogenase